MLVSDLDGHSDLAFLCIFHPSFSATPFTSFLFTGMLESEDDELFERPDEIDEFEFCRCGTFLGMNMRETSSALMDPRPSWPSPSPEGQPRRGWMLGGDATAVMPDVVVGGSSEVSSR